MSLARGVEASMQVFTRRAALSLLLGSLVLGPGCHCGSAGISSRAPSIDVQPSSLVFQPIAVGATALAILQVRNLGSDDLHLAKDPSIVEGDTDNLVEFMLPSILDHDCQGGLRTAARLTLEPGACARVVVKYAPANQDTDSGTLTLDSDDPDHPAITVPISLGTPEKVKICTLKSDGSVDTCDSPSGAPPTLSFGASGLVAKGQSASATFRIFNAGAGPLDGLAVLAPDGASKTEYAVTSAAAPAALAAGSTFDVTVRFSPVGNGLRPAFVEVDSNDPLRGRLQIPLGGRSDGPALCASPDPVDFGMVNLGVELDKTLTLTSCGTVPVNLQTVSLNSFSSPAYGHTTPFPAAQTLQPNQSVTVSLSFLPQDAGSPVGFLQVPNDGNEAQLVKLIAQAIVVPACHLEASVTTLDFGSVVKGQSIQKSVSVANRGPILCNLSGATISSGSAWFTVQNAPTATVQLRPGDAYTVNVTYAVPTSDGNTSDHGTLDFASDDPVHAHLDVALQGEPAAAPLCKLNIVPANTGINPFGGGRVLNFGNVVVGRPRALSATFTNTGSAPCTVGGGTLHPSFLNQVMGGGSCSNSGCLGYSIVPPYAQGTLQPGQTTSINVQFAPANTNMLPLGPDVVMYVDTGDQSIASTSECTGALPPDTKVGCAQIGLTGQGDLSNLQVLPPDLDFGLTTLGCQTQQDKVTLYNTGASASFTIKSLTLQPSTAPFYIQAPPTPFVMKAGTQVIIYIKYKPTMSGRETATLQIETDASNTTSNNPYVTVGLSGTGTTDKHQTDTFMQSVRPEVDMLLVVDQSSSFQDYQTALGQQAPAFITNALKANADFHIAVTGNDPDNDGNDKTDSNASYPNTTYWVGGLYGKPAIIDNTLSTQAAQDAFNKNVRIGTCCSDARESGAESTWKSLTSPKLTTAPPAGSQGFLRDNARLVVLTTTDEVDQSHGNVAFYTDFLQQLKGKYNAGLVSFNAITGDPGNGCDANNIHADANDFDVNLSTNTGGKWWSLCSADWGQIANDLSLSAFSGRVQFPLSRVADPNTLTVTLNGVNEVAGVDYTYDAPSNSIVFKVVPPPGATIVADYDAQCF